MSCTAPTLEALLLKLCTLTPTMSQTPAPIAQTRLFRRLRASNPKACHFYAPSGGCFFTYHDRRQLHIVACGGVMKAVVYIRRLHRSNRMSFHGQMSPVRFAHKYILDSNTFSFEASPSLPAMWHCCEIFIRHRDVTDAYL